MRIPVPGAKFAGMTYVIPLTLHRYPDDILTKKCDDFRVEELKGDGSWQAAFQRALEVCRQNHGYAIAAPQVGSALRWFVVDAHKDLHLTRPQVYINPVITATGGARVSQPEGCLSLPGLRVPVCRPFAIDLTWVNEDGVELKQSGITGLLARVIMHEIDHLNGILTVSRTDALGKKRAESALQAMRQSR